MTDQTQQAKADPDCPLCHGTGIDPGGEPTYHPGAPGIADPASLEPCDCIVRQRAVADEGAGAAVDLADPIANFRFQAEVADGIAPWMEVRTETAKAVLAALDSAQGRVADHERAERAEAEADRLRAAWEQAWAERNEARTRVAELEGERGQQRQQIADALVVAGRWKREGTLMEKAFANQITYALRDRSRNATDLLDRCRDCYGRGDDFEGGTCPTCGGTGSEASNPTPACGPTPNALICACGGPANHEGARS